MTVSDANILEALDPKEDGQSLFVKIFPIRLIESRALWELEQIDVSVELSCRFSKQTVRIPVFVGLIGQKPEFIGRCKCRTSIFTSFCEQQSDQRFFQNLAMIKCAFEQQK